MHKLIQNQPEDFTAKLSPKYNFSSPFSLIRSPLEFSTFFPCQHDSFISIASDLGNCKDCGVYLNRSCNTFGLKTKKNSFKLDIASKPIMENFLKTSIRTPVFSGSSSYLKNRASLIDWLFEMARKLDLSLNTAHLAILFLDLVMAQDQEDLIPIHLFSTTSLLLAAKAIELDERIPFLPKLKKMVAPMYNHDDFKRTEHEILGLLDWKLQIPTIFDILEYYISQGVVFNTDTVSGEEIQNSSIQTPSPNGAQASYIEQKFASPFIHNNEKNHSFLINSIASKSTGIQFYGKITNEKKIYEMISGMEKDMVKLTGLMVKDAGFYNWEPNVLAAGAVGFLRKLNNVTPIWSKELENISLGVKEDEVMLVLDNFLYKYMSYFDNYIFQNRQENLLKEFNNLKLNKENSALGLKKAATSEETLINKSFDNPGGFSGYLRSYTLGLESDALNLPKNNPGMNRNPEGKRLLMNGNNSKAYNHGVSNGFNGYSRNYEEYITNCNHNSNQQLILKDAENKINIYNNNGFRSYFQEKNTSSYSDMNSLTRKIDDIYGKIFINHPLGKKI